VNYVSTRGAAAPLGFVDTLLAGLAPDGGLYMPKVWPTVARDEIAAFAGRPYAEVAADILGRFAEGEIEPATLLALCRQAYEAFDHPAVAPLIQLAPGRFLLELFHGPTLAFKDVAMRILARLYDHVLAARGRTMTIVCATSGDTGGAAVEAFRGLDRVRLVVLFPHGRISEVQRRFMTTAHEDNIRAVAVDGDFDACQAILKALFADQAFAEAVNLSAVNSINFARIIAQSVYYFTAAAALGAPGRPVSFAIPTGNFGDAFAGFAARAMGLPIARLLVATNANDIVARALNTGDYRRGNTLATQSPAMDIQVASNFERLFFECADRDAKVTAQAFAAFAREGALTIPPAILARMRALFAGVAVDEARTAKTMRATLEATGERIDPHTAVALAGADQHVFAVGEGPLVIVSTAHPAKFPEAAAAAIGEAGARPGSVLARAALPERIDRLSAEAGAVKDYVRTFARADDGVLA
jgi:threonine synthase